MKKRNEALIKLASIFLLAVTLWFATASRPNLIIIWLLVILAFSVFFIAKHKNTTKTDILIGLALGLLSMPSNFFMGLFTIPAYLGGVSVLKESKNSIPTIKSGRKGIWRSFLIAIAAGSVLGLINFLLGKASTPINISLQLNWIWEALRAGIAEEVMFRFFFYAICIYFVGDKALSKTESFICYLIMIIPHVLIHFTFKNLDLGSILFLSLLFGLPLSLLQRKRDLVSAIGAHTIIDLIRFFVFGA